MRLIQGKEIDRLLDWQSLMDDIADAHLKPAAVTEDMLLTDPGSASGGGKILTRAAWVPEGSLAVKMAPVFPANQQREQPLPVISTLMVVYDAATGQPQYIIEGSQLTWWKTAADSSLAARYLAPKSATKFLMVGAGSMSIPLISAHLVANPSIQKISVWNRTTARADSLLPLLKQKGIDARVVTDLKHAVAEADIISCATMSDQPVIKGEWLEPGTHLDLVGAYTATMREADDDAISQNKLFVDSRKSAMEIGELEIPMTQGIISEKDIVADHYQLAQGAEGRTQADDITVFKNGGGAHLDLMTASSLIKAIS